MHARSLQSLNDIYHYGQLCVRVVLYINFRMMSRERRAVIGG